MKWRRICAVVLTAVLAASACWSAGAVNLPEVPQPEYTVPQELPVLDQLSCRDTANAAGWSIVSDLAVGNLVYGDRTDTFTQIPQTLLGSHWIRTADRSAGWTGAGALASFRVNRSGTLYLALPAGTTQPDWMADYTREALTVNTTGGSLELYSKALQNGETVTLSAISAARNYGVFFRTKTVDLAPPTPSVTKFLTSNWDASWFRMETDLQLGTVIYSIDTDPTKTELQSNPPEDYEITRLPERFLGCDYMISRKSDARDIYFFAEQDITVYAAIDSARGTNLNWGETGWTGTGETMATADGATYNIYEKSYPMGETVLIQALGGVSSTSRNLFLMVLPTQGEAVSNALTQNPVLPEGTPTQKETADDSYRYYINDVFNQAEGNRLPAGYTALGDGEARLSNGAAYSTRDYAAGENMALGCPVTATSARSGLPADAAVDGDDQTYWNGDFAGLTDNPQSLTVDLEYQVEINQLVLKVRNKASWGDRTQNLEILGSLDGRSYFTVLPRADYLFSMNSDTNTVTIPLAESVELRWLKVVGYTNTGNSSYGPQLAELEVYGPAQTAQRTETVSDRYVILDQAGMVKSLDTPVTGQVILEAKVQTDQPNQKMAIPTLRDAAGNPLVSLSFGENGYIQAGNGADAVNLAPYTAGVWYTVKLILNQEAGTYDVWVDHLQKATEIPMEEAGALHQIVFAANAAGQLLVDNVRLYDNTEIYTVEDDFNALPVGSLPEEGWSITGNGGAQVQPIPFDADRSLVLENSGAAPVQAERRFGPLRGDVTLEVKVKADTSAWVTAPLITDGDGRVVAKVAMYRNSFFISNGDNWVYVCNQGRVMPHNYYAAGNWYYLKVVLNTDTNRYDFYIDGALRYSGASFLEEVEEVSRVSFGVEQDNTLYIDNLKIYDSDSLARGLMPQENVYNVKDFGAVGDGVTDDTAAIAQAVEAAAYTGGTVLLENGVFYTGQITLQSDMTFFLDSSATLLANQDRNVYTKVIPSRGYNGNHQLGRGILYFQDASNVRITGGGTIDGNGFYAWGENDPSNQRPCILYFANSTDVYVDNINMINSPFWTLVPYESSKITIRHVNITNHVAPNRDGIDPVNSGNLTVEDCCIIAGDDAFCPKSGNDIPANHVDVRNVCLQSYCNGIKFGTDSYDNFKDYHFTDVCLKNVGMSGITLQSADGSQFQDITFTRIDMNDVDNPVFLAVGNRGRTPTGSTEKRLGFIQNITFRDMTVANVMDNPYSHKDERIHEILLIGLDPDPQYNTIDGAVQQPHRISNVLFENVYLEMIGGCTTVPSSRQGILSSYPEHTSIGLSPAWGYYLRWTDNVQFVNCTSVLLNPDARQEIVQEDSTNTQITTTANPEFVLGLADRRVTLGTAQEALPLPETVPVALDNGQVVEVAVAGWQAVDGYTPDTLGAYTFATKLTADARVAQAETLTAQVRVFVEEAIAEPPIEAPTCIWTLQEDPRLVSGMPVGCTAEEFAAGFNTDVTLWDLLGNQVTTGQIGTGFTVEFAGKTYTAVLPGDLNGDGSLSVTDVVLLRKAILAGGAGQSPAQRAAGDLNGDNALSVTDVVLLRKTILNQK